MYLPFFIGGHSMRDLNDHELTLLNEVRAQNPMTKTAVCIAISGILDKLVNDKMYRDRITLSFVHILHTEIEGGTAPLVLLDVEVERRPANATLQRNVALQPEVSPAQRQQTRRRKGKKCRDRAAWKHQLEAEKAGACEKYDED